MNLKTRISLSVFIRVHPWLKNLNCRI